MSDVSKAIAVLLGIVIVWGAAEWLCSLQW